MAESAEFFVVRRSSTALSNAVIHDSNLSFAALGLLMVSLSLPPNAPCGYRAFLGRGMGEKAVRKALKELEELNYRFRFRLRREGQLREVTVVADTPITKDEAHTEVVAMMNAGVVKQATISTCVSHPSPEFSTAPEASEPVDNHRAATCAARSETVDNSPTVPRSSAARWSAAHTSNEVSNNSSLRSELNTNQPEGSHGPVAAPADVGVVGENLLTTQAAPPAGEARPDWGLLDECLPATMRRGLSTAAGLTITKALKAAEMAGWTRSQIYRNLNENPLPVAPRNRTGLVIHRVQVVAETPPPIRRKPPRPPAEAPQKATKPKPPPQWVKDFFREKYPDHFRQKDSTPRKEIA